MSALAVIVLSPIFAEYLSGYDTSVGNLPELLLGLLLLAPLYGCPALLIRETARRLGLGWPRILLMAAAFGIVQAGVVDQSFFNSSYRDIDYWDDMWSPTYVGFLGTAPAMALGFLVGHVVWSYAAPVAVAESLSLRRDRPWLNRPWTVIVALLYLAAAWIINRDHIDSQRDDATSAQWGTALGIALALIALAVFLKPRPKRDRPVPRPVFVGVISFVAAAAFQLPEQTWAGFAVCVAILTVSGVLLALAGRSSRWTQRHVVAVIAGPLLSLALYAFLITPLGAWDPWRKYGHNLVLLSALCALLIWAASRARRHPVAVHDPLDVADRVEQMP